MRDGRRAELPQNDASDHRASPTDQIKSLHGLIQELFKQIAGLQQDVLELAHQVAELETEIRK